MPTSIAVALAVVAILGLAAWSLVASLARRRAQELALERLGFRPCPGEKESVLETVTRLENNRGYLYDVRDLRKLEGTAPVHYFTKVCTRGEAGDTTDAGEEILFPLRRPCAGAVTLVVKPSALASGLATRMIGAVATAAWDAQPDDLVRLDLPADLEKSNLLGALGPRGASLYDLVDAGTLAVVQGLGDAGALQVRFRDGWCSVDSGGRQMPFKMEQLVARIRPLLA